MSNTFPTPVLMGASLPANNVNNNTTAAPHTNQEATLRGGGGSHRRGSGTTSITDRSGCSPAASVIAVAEGTSGVSIRAGVPQAAGVHGTNPAPLPQQRAAMADATTSGGRLGIPRRSISLSQHSGSQSQGASTQQFPPAIGSNGLTASNGTSTAAAAAAAAEGGAEDLAELLQYASAVSSFEEEVSDDTETAEYAAVQPQPLALSPSTTVAPNALPAVAAGGPHSSGSLRGQNDLSWSGGLALAGSFALATRSAEGGGALAGGTASPYPAGSSPSFTLAATVSRNSLNTPTAPPGHAPPRRLAPGGASPLSSVQSDADVAAEGATFQLQTYAMVPAAQTRPSPSPLRFAAPSSTASPIHSHPPQGGQTCSLPPVAGAAPPPASSLLHTASSSSSGRLFPYATQTLLACPIAAPSPNTAARGGGGGGAGGGGGVSILSLASSVSTRVLSAAPESPLDAPDGSGPSPLCAWGATPSASLATGGSPHPPRGRSNSNSGRGSGSGAGGIGFTLPNIYASTQPSPVPPTTPPRPLSDRFSRRGRFAPSPPAAPVAADAQLSLRANMPSVGEEPHPFVRVRPSADGSPASSTSVSFAPSARDGDDRIAAALPTFFSRPSPIPMPLSLRGADVTPRRASSGRGRGSVSSAVGSPSASASVVAPVSDVASPSAGLPIEGAFGSGVGADESVTSSALCVDNAASLRSRHEKDSRDNASHVSSSGDVFFSRQLALTAGLAATRSPMISPREGASAMGEDGANGVALAEGFGEAGRPLVAVVARSFSGGTRGSTMLRDCTDVGARSASAVGPSMVAGVGGVSIGVVRRRSQPLPVANAVSADSPPTINSTTGEAPHSAGPATTAFGDDTCTSKAHPSGGGGGGPQVGGHSRRGSTDRRVMFTASVIMRDEAAAAVEETTLPDGSDEGAGGLGDALLAAVVGGLPLLPDNSLGAGGAAGGDTGDRVFLGDTPSLAVTRGRGARASSGGRAVGRMGAGGSRSSRSASAGRVAGMRPLLTSGDVSPEAVRAAFEGLTLPFSPSSSAVPPPAAARSTAGHSLSVPQMPPNAMRMQQTVGSSSFGIRRRRRADPSAAPPIGTPTAPSNPSAASIPTIPTSVLIGDGAPVHWAADSVTASLSSSSAPGSIGSGSAKGAPPPLQQSLTLALSHSGSQGGVAAADGDGPFE